MPSRRTVPGRLAELLVRMLIRLYPRSFRRRFGDGMRALFMERYAAASRDGRTSAAKLVARTAADLAVAALAERRASSLSPTLPPGTPDRRSTFPDRGDGTVANLRYDLRHAARMLLARPAYTALVVVTLALGIGANTAIFSVVDGVLLDPLPYEEPERLISVWGRFDPESGFDFPIFPLSYPESIDYRDQSESLEDVAFYFTTGATVTGDDAEPERVPVARITPNLLSVLRAAPVHGRGFTVEEGLPDGDEVVLLEHGYWRSRFAGDPGIVGTAIALNGVPVTVVGVMPPGFEFPSPAERMWRPLRLDPANPGNRQSHNNRAIGRLAPAMTLEQARAELETINAAWQQELPEIHTGHYLFLRPRLEDVTGNARTPLLLLLAASGAVLLIVCANVASVALARGEERSREIAMRAAVGAGRGRLVQLLLSESMLLAAVGGLLGVALARGGVAMILSLDAGAIPRAAMVEVDRGVLLFAAAASFVTGLVFGLFPALTGAAADVQSTLRQGGSAGHGRRRVAFRGALVVVQVALCFTLVLGAGLMTRSLGRMLGVDPGFQAVGRLAGQVSLPSARYADVEEVSAFYRTLLEQLEALPGVRRASGGTGLPIVRTMGVWDFVVEGRPEPAAGEMAWNASFAAAFPGYFEALAVPIVSGRAFRDADDADAEIVAVINETMAHRHFADASPIGRRIRVAGNPSSPWMRIVGVVGDMRYDGLALEPSPVYYTPFQQIPAVVGGPVRSAAIVLEVETDPASLIEPFRRVVRELDPELPVTAVGALDEAVRNSAAGTRFTAVLLGMLATVALALGATGIYGVLAHAVARRQRELGIRKALGAPGGRLAGMVIRQGMWPVATGLAIGGIASYWSTRLIAEQLFEVSPLDAGTYALVLSVLVAVSLVACSVPTIRALRADALVALNAE